MTKSVDQLAEEYAESRLGFTQLYNSDLRRAFKAGYSTRDASVKLSNDDLLKSLLEDATQASQCCGCGAACDLVDRLQGLLKLAKET